jgi:hyperosmotically inducible protein
MKAAISSVMVIALSAVMAGCSSDHKSPDVTSSIRSSLDQAGLKDVSVSQDRDKGVVTLTGDVRADADKAQAESIAKSVAGSQVVADEIAVVPPHDSDAKTVDADLDKAIEKNLDAALIQNHMQHDVSHDVKNGVVTLTGNVGSQTRRARAEQLATQVPNVQQVVNELQVKEQKATSTN